MTRLNELPLADPIILKKKVSQMSRAEKEDILAKIMELEKEAERKEAQAKAADPFWFYTPSTGKVTGERLDFLRKHLKEEDIPPVLTGQLDVHLSKAPIRGASGGNQSGKTTVGAIEAFITATGEVPFALKGIYPEERMPKRFPQHVRVVGKDWENGILLNVLPTYQYWAPKEFMPEGKWEKAYSAEKATLFLSKNGQLRGTIEFMSNAQAVTSFQGPPRDKMIYDEEPRLDIYKENLMRFTTRDRVDVLFCMTPTEGLTWVYDLVSAGSDSGRNLDWFQLASVVNDKANIGVLEQAVQDLSYEEKKMRLLGEFVSLSGLVYGKAFTKKLHLIKPFKVSCDCGGINSHDPQCPWSLYYVLRGLDPHLVTPTAVVWEAVDRFENYYVASSWANTADVEEVKNGIHERSKGMRIGWSVTDSAADSDIQAFGGLNIFKKLTTGNNKIRALRLASKGQGSIKTGIDELKKLLRPQGPLAQPRIFVMDTPENKDVVMAFQTMERDKGMREDKRGPSDKILESRHHKHAALRYIHMQNVRWRSPADMVATLSEASYDLEDVLG